MIQIHINPARVEKVLFVRGSDMEDDFDWAAWQTIKPLVDKIDRRLKRVVKGVLRRSEKGHGDGI